MLPTASAEEVHSQYTVNICAVMFPQKGKAEELRSALLSLVKPTRTEEGHITYDVYQEKNGGFFLHEVWRSQADLERHFKKPYIQDFVKKSATLLEGANDAHFGKLVAATSKAAGTAIDAKAASTVHICSIKRPRKGKEVALREALSALVKPTNAEEGNLTYNIYEEADGSLFLYEAWRSQADLDNHFAKPYIKDFQTKVGDLAERNQVFFGKVISEAK